MTDYRDSHDDRDDHDDHDVFGPDTSPRHDDREAFEEKIRELQASGPTVDGRHLWQQAARAVLSRAESIHEFSEQLRQAIHIDALDIYEKFVSPLDKQSAQLAGASEVEGGVVTAERVLDDIEEMRQATVGTEDEE